METIRLNNGVEMPLVGYGVFQVNPQECERCVSDALKTGYKLIDTAQAYQNEEGVGAAWTKSGIAREELFITTKVWISNSGEARAAASIDESLRKLKTDYIDLLLIHQAFGDYYGTYRAMQEALKAGKVRAIGVSNFRPDRFIDLIRHIDVMPAVNQLETNVFCQQNEMRELMKQTGTQLMAWAPMAEGRNNFFKHEVLAAIGSKYGKSAAQVGLRFLTQQGIVVIPKSTKAERMQQNMDISDFQLSADDMQKIVALNETDGGTVAFNDPNFVNYILNYKV
ncbi:MAG: aldo/keto reductase [Prevotella sp.]|nr:aldo/keto reductase [Prevotella sp.]MBQ9671082.1 aldo/keto reductase [Prevotella sp.]MDY6408754.1 aldo/keto reductase [Prevotella sp.]